MHVADGDAGGELTLCSLPLCVDAVEVHKKRMLSPEPGAARDPCSFRTHCVPRNDNTFIAGSCA